MVINPPLLLCPLQFQAVALPSRCQPGTVLLLEALKAKGAFSAEVPEEGEGRELLRQRVCEEKAVLERGFLGDELFLRGGPALTGA